MSHPLDVGSHGIDETEGREDHERMHCSGRKEVRGGYECGAVATYR